MADSIGPRFIFETLDGITGEHIERRKDQFKRVILAYVNRNANLLQISGPSRKLIFSEGDKEALYLLGNIKKEQVLAVIKDCPAINKTWKILNDPFNILITVYLVHFMLKKDKQMTVLCYTYLLLKFYSSLQYKYACYGYNENIMTYTINMMSNKFKIKKFRTIFDTIMDTANICFATHETRLLTKEDINLNNFIMALNTRINGLLLKIKSMYEIARKKGGYFNTEEDDYSEDNYRLTNNASFDIVKLTNSIMNFAISRPVSDKIVKTCAKACDVSFNETRTCIQNILTNKTDELRKIFNLIFELFLMDGKHKAEDVNSKIFLAECFSIYKSSNTKDQSIIDIKDLLDRWLNETSLTYQRTQRLATKNNLRRAIFTYFVFFIYSYKL